MNLNLVKETSLVEKIIIYFQIKVKVKIEIEKVYRSNKLCGTQGPTSCVGPSPILLVGLLVGPGPIDIKGLAYYS